ncbi:hypothetical protein EDB81DRAFT_419551 [Dactylonectria macrodidyma]|uniref:Uncharacterized protein n=1 Tax=Dactylonectria macrodidyma TaxID=307937 RepID=A0A9P9I6L0_9HYPO|nr:hypothetical protein EDB81DRAFT_419551 [Dactylonectria macrodidyma]
MPMLRCQRKPLAWYGAKSLLEGICWPISCYLIALSLLEFANPNSSHGATPDTEKCDKASLQSSQSGDDIAKDNNSPEYNETGDKEDQNTENNICCCWPEEVKVVELSCVVGEPPMEAAREVGATTTTTHDAGATDEPSNSAANLPEPCGGVTQLTHAAVAAVAAVQKWPCKSTAAQGEDGDGDGKKEAGDEDDENSDGWTELGRLPDLLSE